MFQSQLRQQLEALRPVRVVGERERDRAVQEGHQRGRHGRVSGPVHGAGARRADVGVERVREADERPALKLHNWVGCTQCITFRAGIKL